MKKKVVYTCMAVLGAGIVISAALLGLFICDARDYKETLGVNRVEAKGADRLPQNAVGVSQDGGIPGNASRLPGLGQEASEEGAADGRSTIAGKTARSHTINILFLGIDRTEARDKSLSVYRTDTIALARIDMETNKVEVLCIPRDTYAYIPGSNIYDKINHAYAFGSIKGNGIKGSIEAVNGFIRHSSVDYYFAMDMQPVPDIVDDMGGVEIDVEIDMKDHGANLSKGRQVLNGHQAFDYIHWRYSGEGDIGRIKRQQKFIRAVLSELRDRNKLVNSVKLVLKYNKHIKTNMDTQQLVSLATLAQGIKEQDIRYHIVPGQPKMMNGIWYWLPDKEKTRALLKSIFQPDNA